MQLIHRRAVPIASLVGLLLATVLLLAAVAPAQAKPLFGFNEDWSATRHDIQTASPFRPSVQRLRLNWAFIETAPDTSTWTEPDRQYRKMVAQGVRPLALVMGAPCWAARPERSCSPAGRLLTIDPGHLDAWERFVGEVVRRYPDLAAVEVWNEPNLPTFHHPGPNVAAYVRTLERAHRGSKAVRPSLPVLAGSLAPVTNARRARRDGGFPRQPGAPAPYAPFLDQMYRLGAGRYMDGLAFHPYPNFAPYLRERRRGPGVRRGFAAGIRADLRKQVGTVRRIGRRHGVRKPIWATETGVCTTGPRERRASAREQAVALEQIYRELGRLDVAAILMHRLWDVRIPGTPLNNIEHGCGLTYINGKRKPAWSALLRLRIGRAAARRVIARTKRRPARLARRRAEARAATPLRRGRPDTRSAA